MQCRTLRYEKPLCLPETKGKNKIITSVQNEKPTTLFHYLYISGTLIFNIRILFNHINMDQGLLLLKPSEQKELLRGVNCLLLCGNNNVLLTPEGWLYYY
jgi:hypothetical protein